MLKSISSFALLMLLGAPSLASAKVSDFTHYSCEAVGFDAQGRIGGAYAVNGYYYRSYSQATRIVCNECMDEALEITGRNANCSLICSLCDPDNGHCSDQSYEDTCY